mmetsp:Transcript_123953/g.358480  ORF Transcript_123953/g.358480 Transcript_123953/m.358480 type:complete len:207 (+) Transcript_123953:671-1291(+)
MASTRPMRSPAPGPNSFSTICLRPGISAAVTLAFRASHAAISRAASLASSISGAAGGRRIRNAQERRSRNSSIIPSKVSRPLTATITSPMLTASLGCVLFHSATTPPSRTSVTAWPPDGALGSVAIIIPNFDDRSGRESVTSRKVLVAGTAAPPVTEAGTGGGRHSGSGAGGSASTSRSSRIHFCTRLTPMPRNASSPCSAVCAAR